MSTGILRRSEERRTATGHKAASSLNFEELYEYPDGTRVLCAAMLEVEDGRIFCQTNIEAWDEQSAPVRKV